MCTSSSKIGEENFSKKSVVVSQKTLISKRGCIIIRWVNFSKGVQAIFGEKRQLHNCIIINN